MSVGPTNGIGGSIAGTPLSQLCGSEVDRTAHDTAAQHRTRGAHERAERAGGIGQTDEDYQIGDRDANGRRLAEALPPDAADTEEDSVPSPAEPGGAGLGPAGQTGARIDLSG